MKAPASVCERPVTALRVFSDAWIERWASVYLDRDNNRRLKARGVTFETFLYAPAEILSALDRPRVVVTRCGLLPKQRDAQKRADIEASLLVMADLAIRQMKPESHCADGAWTEKTRHHAWPRRSRRKSSLVTEN